MPDPTDTEEQDTEEQDQEAMPVQGPSVVTPPVMAPQGAAPVPVMPPTGPRVRAPNGPTELDYALEMARQKTVGMPTEQANQAVAAALKFQGMRGYQNDLQAGKSPSEALAKWAPIILSGPKESTMSGYASMIKATSQEPTLRNASGVLYRIGPDGKAIAITPPRPVPTSVNRFDLQTHANLLKQIEELQKDLDAEPQGPEADAKRDKLGYLRTEADSLRNRGATPVTAPGVPAPAAAPPRVTTQAQYDALASGTVYISTNGRRHRKP